MMSFRTIAATALLALTTGQLVPIGSALSDGTQLIYESEGVAQAPWVYDSVRVTPHDEFDRCVTVFRPDQPERTSCVRGDTLFQPSSVGNLVASRPIAPEMRLTVRTAAGLLLEYQTGESEFVRLTGLDREIASVATTIVTRDSAGTIVQRLREDYAPELLTALGGIFETPDAAGGWDTQREFVLHEVRPRAPGE